MTMRKTYPPAPRIRALWLLAAVLQLVLPGATAWADARPARYASGAVVHVEAANPPTCSRAHAADCGLCRYLAMAACAGDLPPAFGTVPPSRSLPASAPDRASVATHHALPRSRAPPHRS